MKKLFIILAVLIISCEKQDDLCTRNEIEFIGKVYIDQPLGENYGYPYSYSGTMHPGDSSIVRIFLLSDTIYKRRGSKIYKLRSNEKLFLE